METASRATGHHGHYAKGPDGSEFWVFIKNYGEYHTTEIYRYTSVRKNGTLRKNAKPLVTGREYRGAEYADDWFMRTRWAIEDGEYTFKEEE